MILEPFEPEFMRRAFAEAALVGVLGGLLGTWIVLRSLAFYTHAVGTATFPGLVLAEAWGVAAQLPALVTAVATALVIQAAAAVRPRSPDAATGLVLVAALAIGVILASDVYEIGAGVDRLLFGSLLAVSATDIWLTAGVAALALAATAAGSRSWLASGFDRGSAGALGVRPRIADALLLATIAIAVVAALDAVGALLVGALFVQPAAAARLVTARVRTLQAVALGLAVAEAVGGLWLAYHLDIPPGPAVAVLGGAVLALAAGAHALRGRATAAVPA